MIGDIKMQTIKQRTGRSLTGDRPLFLALMYSTYKNQESRIRDKKVTKKRKKQKQLNYSSIFHLFKKSKLNLFIQISPKTNLEK